MILPNTLQSWSQSSISIDVAITVVIDIQGCPRWKSAMTLSNLVSSFMITHTFPPVLLLFKQCMRYHQTQKGSSFNSEIWSDIYQVTRNRLFPLNNVQPLPETTPPPPLSIWHIEKYISANPLFLLTQSF